jgi:pumilio RNA-binding family
MKATGMQHSQDHQNSFSQSHGHHRTVLHPQQNVFEQARGGQYYNTHQIDNMPMHVQPTMHHQALQSSGNINPSMFVNPSYGGYTTLQYHQAPPQHFGHAINPVMHPHGTNLNTSLSHPPQYMTAVPIQGGIPGQMNAVPSNGTFIYFHQPGHAPAQTHPQPIAIVDANGHPATIAVSQNRIQKVSREHVKSPSMMGNRGNEKTNRKSGRGANGKKGNSASSMDASRHSLSSSTLSLLEEYRSSKDKSWTAEDVKGHIVEFCQDQNGSRFVQQRLEVAKHAEMALITSEILSSVHILRNDVFGNYVVQKLFEHGNHEIRSTLKKSLEGQMVSLSSQMYGCRVAQKALEKMDDDNLIDLLSEFHDTVLTCIHDQNGNHVIQKIIQVVSSRSKTYQAEDKEKAIKFSTQLHFILDCVIENIVPLSCHPFGCRVLQRILEHCIESQKSTALDTIQRCLRTLLDDQYGNYVIQHVLQFGRKSDRDVVLQIVIGNGILGLSRQKFASNVIEKLLKYGNSSQRNEIVREMLKVVNDKTVENGQCTVALLMVRDAYANYVVQTTLNVVPEGEEKELLLQELRNNSMQLVSFFRDYASFFPSSLSHS